jgi:hypothetical protein
MRDNGCFVYLVFTWMLYFIHISIPLVNGEDLGGILYVVLP